MSSSLSPLHRWESAVASSPIVRFFDAVLRGFGQVMFQNSPITGLFFLIGLFVGGWDFGTYALLACVVSTGTAYWLGIPQGAIGSGLYGYNAVL
jgi:urea transporter